MKGCEATHEINRKPLDVSIKSQGLDQFKIHKPEVVLMYGMSNINALKDSIRANFPTAKFKMVKAVKLKVPQHHIGKIDGTTFLLTTQIPALRHNRIETGFDWEELGKMVRSDR